MIFCPSNAHNSNVQSVPGIKYSFSALLSLCIVREPNPPQQLGRLLCYHYTNDAEKVYDRRDEFQTCKLGFFLTNILSVTSKRNQNYSLRSGVVIRLICFSLIKSCRFWFVTSQGFGDSKRDKNSLFHEYFVFLTHTIVKFNLSWN